MTVPIIKRILLLLLVFYVLDRIYTYFIYPADLAEHYPQAIEIRQTQPHTDIYYFGESSNVTFHPADTNKKSISTLIQEHFPRFTVTTINKYATHAGIYRNWIRQLEMPADKPRALIITMNLRSFDAAWINSELETQLLQGLVLAEPLPPLLNRFLLSLEAFDSKTTEERELDMLKNWRTTVLKFPFPFTYTTVAQWDKAMATGGHLHPDGSWDMKKIVLACHYIKSYAFNINDDNPRISDFDAIYRWSKENNVPLYFNLMAENLHFADSLVGRELVFLMKQNRDILVKRYNRGICTVIDNLDRVGGTSFIDKDWTTEHYDFKGRLTIAKHVSDSLRKRFESNYKKVY